MTLEDFDKVRPYLKDNVEIELVQAYRLVPKYWGNHDGRWNVECEACGWMSEDIPKNSDSPYARCPKCGKGKYYGKH